MRLGICKWCAEHGRSSALSSSETSIRSSLCSIMRSPSLQAGHVKTLIELCSCGNLLHNIRCKSSCLSTAAVRPTERRPQAPLSVLEVDVADKATNPQGFRYVWVLCSLHADEHVVVCGAAQLLVQQQQMAVMKAHDVAHTLLSAAFEYRCTTKCKRPHVVPSHAIDDSLRGIYVVAMH